MFIATLFHDNQDMDTTKCPLRDEWMKTHGAQTQWNTTQPKQNEIMPVAAMT